MNLHVDRSRSPRLARAILQRELLPGTPLATTLSAVFGSLESVVSGLVGLSGYRGLMRRALHRAATRCSSLLAIEPTSGFPRDGWSYLIARIGEGHAEACAAELLTSAIEQLCGVIGRDLTYRLIDRTWKGLPGEQTAVCEPVLESKV
ncbi:MAG: hypothetical protein RLZZ450_1248 [Pseudomonadota bacterium]|jgi:hypothetical protein